MKTFHLTLPALLLVLTACGSTVPVARQEEAKEVNIGYGTATQETISSAVSSVPVDTDSVPYADIYEMLQGKASGVVVTGKSVKIRGVNSDSPLNKLVEYGFITEVGRLDAPGRPLLFGTTEQFLRSFKVRSIEDLPQMNPDVLEDFKAHAEKEIQIKLDI